MYIVYRDDADGAWKVMEKEGGREKEEIKGRRTKKTGLVMGTHLVGYHRTILAEQHHHRRLQEKQQQRLVPRPNKYSNSNKRKVWRGGRGR